MADHSDFLAGRRVGILAFSRQGMETARRACRALSAAGERRLYAPARLAEGDFQPIEGSLADFTGPLFQWADALLFVGSCGIAVRAVAPHLRHKAADPAVLAVDERAQFVVPLLSGHIGGANRLARLLAEELGAQAAVTTATDVNGKFSVDAWAAERGLHIGSMEDAKAVSAAILEGPVGLASDFPVVGELPPGVVWGGDPDGSGERPAAGFYVSWRRREVFERTLLLTPKVVHLGIGCRRGTGWEAIRSAVDRALEESGVQRAAVKCAASIDLKRDEPGLRAYCAREGLPIAFYSARELAAVEGAFTPSEFVRSVTGVDNVCERAALLGAKRLIMKKFAQNGVTVAAAAEDWEVRFE